MNYSPSEIFRVLHKNYWLEVSKEEFERLDKRECTFHRFFYGDLIMPFGEELLEVAIYRKLRRKMFKKGALEKHLKEIKEIYGCEYDSALYNGWKVTNHWDWNRYYDDRGRLLEGDFGYHRCAVLPIMPLKVIVDYAYFGWPSSGDTSIGIYAMIYVKKLMNSVDPEN